MSCDEICQPVCSIARTVQNSVKATSGLKSCIETPMGSLCFARTYAEQTLGYFGASVVLSTSTATQFRCVWSSWKESGNKFSLLGGWRACCLWKCVKSSRDKHFARNHLNLTILISFPCFFRKKVVPQVFEEKIVFKWHVFTHKHEFIYMCRSHKGGALATSHNSKTIFNEGER